MKKLISVIIAMLTVMLSVCTYFPVSAAENVVFVCEGGTGDGSSDASPLGSLSEAYKKLGAAGGTIVICGSYQITSTVYEEPHTGEVVVTQVYGGKDYRNGTENTVYIKSQGKRYVLAGPTTFENINFKGDLAATNNYILWIAEYNPITMGEGITSIDFTYSTIAKALTILGGCQSGESKANTIAKDPDSKITVKSGKFIIVGFNRQMNATFTGCSHINIEGGEITTLYAGSVNNGAGGDSIINITGGKFTGQITGAYANPSLLKGSVTINVSGGDFSECPGIYGNVDGHSVIDISKHPEADAIKAKLTDFDEIITADGVDRQIPVTDAFKSGSFTDSKGTTIPYRYYVPEDYDSAKTYPLFLYMHGNGSRGSDNVIQLTTNGAALNTKVYNSDYQCIMIAPQCPSSSAWVDNARYPGTANFNTTTEMSKYLHAAKELFDKFVADYSVDTKRIYVTGSSNGGAATWELIYRFPHTFAAAVPLAGSGYHDGAAELGKYLTTTPITTYHGSSDSTLNVLGTRSIVEAIKNAGGTNVNYTEYPGMDHNIWQKAANEEGLVDWIFSQVNENYSPAERKYGEESEVTEPVTDPVTEPVTDPATEPVTEPATDPATDPSTEPMTDPVTEPITEPSADGASPVQIAVIAVAVITVAAIIVGLIIKSKKK